MSGILSNAISGLQASQIALAIAVRMLILALALSNSTVVQVFLGVALTRNRFSVLLTNLLPRKCVWIPPALIS